MKGYTCYLLQSQFILSHFTPKYPKVFGEHVTDRFFVGCETPIQKAQSVKVVGYADSGDGLEALVVEVNHSTLRSDGLLYHITLSLDPEVDVAPDIAACAAKMGYAPKMSYYTPAHSNYLLLARGHTLLPPERQMKIEVTERFFSFETKTFEMANVV